MDLLLVTILSCYFAEDQPCQSGEACITISLFLRVYISAAPIRTLLTDTNRLDKNLLLAFIRES